MNPYGFDWGPVHVERLEHVDGGGYALRIYTDHDEVQVYVSEKGRKVKAYRPGKGNLTKPASDEKEQLQRSLNSAIQTIEYLSEQNDRFRAELGLPSN